MRLFPGASEREIEELKTRLQSLKEISGKPLAAQDQIIADRQEKEIAADLLGGEEEYDLIREAVEISKSPEGLPIPLFNITPIYNSNIEIKEPAMDNSKGIGKQLTRPERDAVEIFKILKKCKQNQIEQEKLKQKELERKARDDYEYFIRKYPNISDRYTIDRELMDLNYFMRNLYGCKWCSKRFDNEQDHKLHERTHMLYMKI
jgi:hypothetical protein